MSLPASTGRARRPRGPAISYASIVVVLLVVIAAVALKTTEPPPPAIAEFAPTAVQQIKQSTQGQGNGNGQGEGKGPGACAPGTPTCPGVKPGPILPKPGQPPVIVPNIKTCVGDPPRQTEDPQSPPCVPYFNGPNGGATYNGVTADSINIVCAGDCRDVENMIVYFNRRFQFYGRKLVLADTKGCAAGSGPAGERAVADCWVKEKHAFAVLTTGGDEFLPPTQYALKDELARDKAVAIDYGPVATGAQLAAHAPYWLQYAMSNDVFEENVGQWACSRLAGKLAAHAGAPLNALTRKFGILVLKASPDDPLSSARLRGALQQCGVTVDPADDVSIIPNGEVDTDTDQQYATTMVNFHKDGVTSVFCICVEFQATQIGSAATGQDYYPEWLVSTYGQLDNDWGLAKFGFGRDHLDHTFGLAVVPRQIPISRSFSDQAVKEGNPADDPYYAANGFTHQQRDIVYRNLLLLSSAIQMAGPHLTPAAMIDHLHQTVFPNPVSELTPGKVGFTDGGYAMTEDVAEYWWSSTAQSPYRDNGGSSGSVCYVDRGRRHRLGEWSKQSGDPFFTTPCFSGGSG